jgi:arylsulfatase A-like enzyme
MKVRRKLWLGLLAGVAGVMVVSSQASAQQQQKPNILFIMGDDIGWMQVGLYHEGIGLGETPNIDRIGREGAKFMDYLAMQSCTSGRNAFFTGMYPLRTGMIPPQLPGSPSYLQPGTPALAVFLRDLGYTTGEFGKNHLGDHTAALFVSPGRDAAGELPRHQQDAGPTRHCSTLQEHADPRRPRGSWRCGS